jgi:hypothetical protein
MVTFDMKINLRNLNTYYINLDEKEDRRISIEYTLNRLNFSSVTRVSGVKCDDGKVGCARSQHKVLSDTSIQTPFLLMEDDCLFTGNYDFEIKVPDDADALYLGNSQWARYLNFSGPFLHYQKIDDRIVKVYNMLAAHAVIYFTDEYRQVCSRISKYCGYQLLDHMDNGYAEIQKYYNVYSLNMPIFKQSGNNGGVTSSKITEMGIPVSSSDNFFNQVKYDLNKLQGVPDLNNCPSTYYPSKIV